MALTGFFRWRIVAAALPACMTLAAGDTVHWGFAIHPNFPMSDLHDDVEGHRVGIGGSFQVSIETSPCTILRPRADFDIYPVFERNRPGTQYRDKVTLSSMGLGADFLYAFSGSNDQGLYGLVGAGFVRWRQSRSSRDVLVRDAPWRSDRTTHNRTSFWGAVGAGYQFTPAVGLEGRLVGSRYNAIKPGTAGTRHAVIGQLALTCRW